MAPLYHGSPDPVVGVASPFGKFFRFSHFGSRNAAMGALVAKEQGAGFIYEVELLVAPSQILHLEDWGGPFRLPLLVELTSFFEKSDRILFHNLTEKMRAAGREKSNGNRPKAEEIATAAIDDFCLSRNIRVFSYENKVEGSDSEVSYCVVFDKDVIVKSSEKIDSEGLKGYDRYLSDARLAMLGPKTD